MLEPEGQFTRSSHCTCAVCLEVRRDGEFVLVRDSKDVSIPPMRFSTEEWRAFVAGVKDGEFDV